MAKWQFITQSFLLNLLLLKSFHCQIYTALSLKNEKMKKKRRSHLVVLAFLNQIPQHLTDFCSHWTWSTKQFPILSAWLTFLIFVRGSNLTSNLIVGESFLKNSFGSRIYYFCVAVRSLQQTFVHIHFQPPLNHHISILDFSFFYSLNITLHNFIIKIIYINKKIPVTNSRPN